MSAPMAEKDNPDLPPSKLGTKDYWDAAYEKEIENFSEIGEPGEVWFGYGSVRRVIKWMEKANLPTDSSVLDLGCGNGVMLVELHKEGWTQLTGVDYSEKAVNLAKAVAEKEGMDIHYEAGDLIGDLSQSAPCLSQEYDILIDKGTYDAISLNPDAAFEKRKKYIDNTVKLVKINGFLIMTSCNWTEEELKSQFLNGNYDLHEKIPSPTFSFGGQIGNRETSLVFQRKK